MQTRLYQTYKWHAYFWNQIHGGLRFLIPENQNVLFLGPYHYDHLKAIRPAKATIVCANYFDINPKMAKCYQTIIENYDDFVPQSKYDIVIIFFVAGLSQDIIKLFGNLRLALEPDSRLILIQHNHLWNPLLKLGGWLGLKNEEQIQNWLSIRDIDSYLVASGLEICHTHGKTLLPAHLFYLGGFINFLAVLFPFFDILKLIQFIVARQVPIIQPHLKSKSLTICLTVRDERENIEPIVKSFPIIAEDQEILFVEGYSTDGTRDEIQRIIPLYPEKNVRVIGQPGIGQGDAIRTGFHDARGDVIILYEGDGTANPEEVLHFYQAIVSGWMEFIEGSRFVYPLSNSSIAPINQLGNMIFARWFSWFFKGHMTDVLSGIKAISKNSYERIYNQWGFLGLTDPFGDFELLYGAGRFGLKLGEIPIHSAPRTYGTSKTKVFRHGYSLLRLALKGYFIFRKLHVPYGESNS